MLPQASLDGRVDSVPEVMADSEEASAERKFLYASQMQQQVIQELPMPVEANVPNNCLNSSG